MADEQRHDPAPAAGEPPSGRPDRGFAARQATLVVLRAVRAHATFDVALAGATAPLSELDRRLVHEIAAGVLRARDALDALIVPRVTGDWRRVSEDMRDVLRIGAYQIHHLTRVPVHAAVAATVEVAKRAHGPRSAGFANAVLRRLAQDAVQGTSAEPPAPPVTDTRALARRYSHPAWLVGRWVERFGIARTEALLVHNAGRSAVHLQPARWPLARLREAFQASAVPFTEVDGLPGVAVRGVHVHDLPGYPEGAFVVQDPAQALALEYIALPEGVLIWDACAAPGGKAARLSVRGPVLASDPRRARLPRLVDTVHRAAPAVWIVCADALAAPLRPASLSAVLLDVPCSATGTIAKHPDSRWHLSPRRIERLAQLQAALLDAVATMVRPGGVLAYLTCSLEREENGDQVDAFLARHADYRRMRDDLFLFPPDLGTDGAFAARLERAA
jgi:16S rRNA (cytosine967-C5)-methyltransferase